MSDKKTLSDIPVSVLNLVPSYEGKTHKESLERSVRFAQLVDKLGYKRLWISEHHNTDGLLSSATVILMGLYAQATQNIRIGSGGVMLPNHVPLIVAEQVGTLETLYPNRIDLGLGRAPGTDQLTARVLRRERVESVNDFPNDVQELQFFLSDYSKESKVRAIPGESTHVPIYLLGSSTFSAQLAAALGLPYVFASHFAPTHLFDSLKIYKKGFVASEQIEKSFTMAAVNVVIANTDEEANQIATSMELMRLSLFRNERGPLKTPVTTMEGIWTDLEKAQAQKMGYYSFIGTPEKVKKGLDGFISQTGIDELMVSSFIYDETAEKKSYELLMEVKNL